MNSRHVLVTGGTGFIGSALCRGLIRQGCQVTVLSRSPHQAQVKLPGVQAIARLEELPTLPAVDSVVNLAGEPLATRRWTQRRKEAFYSSRVGLTEQLYDYFSNGETIAPKTLVSGSAIGYYGGQGDKPLQETACSEACFASELCRAWESMACQFENLGTRVCNVRTGIVLGEGGALAAMLPPFRFGLGGPMGDGRHWMSWIHLEDMVSILLACLDDEALSGAINATAPEPVTNREFARTLGRVLRRPAFLPMPTPVLRLMFGELADELLLVSQRVLPEKLLNHGFTFRYGELEPALRGLLQRQ